MKIDKLSPEARDGLLGWAIFQHADELLFDSIGSLPTEWAWVLIQLKVADDKPEWFPRGKWATLQAIEQFLLEEARAEKRT